MKMSPYAEHPVFEKPDDPDVKIWRYMDFTKFVSMLDKKALYFTRADILAEKYDKFDSLYHPEFVERTLKLYSDKKTKKRILHFFNGQKEFRKENIINCWHINDDESAAMWNTYSHRGYGIAIQSSFNKLVKSFDVFKENEVHIGKVFYSIDKLQFDNAYFPFMVKRKCFEYENELRAVILNIWSNYFKREFDDERLSHEGEYIPVDLGVLIENIYLAPNTEKWVSNVINSILCKYDMNVLVQPSILDREPHYN